MESSLFRIQNNTRRVMLALLISCSTVATTILQTYDNSIPFTVLIKHGPKNSYFGYSIAQHATFEPENINSTFKPYILVGAPKADLSRTPGVKRPGAIYKCDLSSSYECLPLDIESTAALSSQSNDYSSRNAINTNTNNNTNDKRTTGQLLASNMDLIPDRNDQWLGVSVRSQGPNGYAVACAHRHVLQGPGVRWAQGICYSLRKNLTLHKSWVGKTVNKRQRGYRYLQVGTSCDISENSDLTLGAPGAYTWRGTAVTHDINPTAKEDRNWYMAAVTDGEAKVNKYSYLGMSIVSGKFFNDTMYYASGAPRSEDVGQVLIMTKPSSNSGYNLDVEQVLDGEQMGSSYGYQLATIDFNGDGRLDLAVAAPFFFSQSEGGKVYLYTNDGKSFKHGVTLTGRLESRFGLALANCRDLNHDGYDDLAVGAPYDPAGGAVYIYLGSQNCLRTVPSQVIRASATGSNNLQTFGYSLSGGIDLDRNGYPDLAVGSYADDSIYILRIGPIT